MIRYFVEMTCGNVWIYCDGWFPEDGYIRFFIGSDIVADLPRVFVNKITRKNYDALDEQVIVM